MSTVTAFDSFQRTITVNFFEPYKMFDAPMFYLCNLCTFICALTTVIVPLY